MKLKFGPSALLVMIALGNASFALADIAAGSAPSTLLTSVVSTGGVDPLFNLNFSFIDPTTGESGSATLDASCNGSGLTETCLVGSSGSSLTLSGGTGQYAGTYNLVPFMASAGYWDNTPYVYSPSGYFAYDDVLNPEQPSSYVTLGGLLFTNGSFEINIYDSTYNSPGPATYVMYVNSGFNTPISITSVTDPVPEPAAILLLAMMILGVGITCRRLLNWA